MERVQDNAKKQGNDFQTEGMKGMAPPAFSLGPVQMKCALCGGECQGECPECKEKNEKGEKVLEALKPFGYDLEEEASESEPVQAKFGVVQLHTAADCDEWKEDCDDRCRNLPNKTKGDKFRRAMCWAACIGEYATCLASSREAITFEAMVAAIALACIDGPLPVGDAAAAAILVRVGAMP
jgi:hypothetical protein